MTINIDWDLIELTEIYESFDMILQLLDEDFGRACRIIESAIKHGAEPESMTEPIEVFAMELQAYCKSVNGQKDKQENKTLNS